MIEPAADFDVNPFSTRFIKPGAVEFLFPNGQSVEGVLRRLAAHNWCGEIVGPHGSGKSTLVRSLLPPLARQGRRPRLFTLRQGQRRLPRSATRPVWTATDVVIVDGYEQLGWLQRRRLQRLRRRCRAGLIATSHRPTGLPGLYATRVNEQLAARILDRLLVAERRLIDGRDLARARAACGENFREALFLLYDIHEGRSRALSTE